MAHILEPGGTYVVRLSALQVDAAQRWSAVHDSDPLPMPIEETDVATVLADLADAMFRTDMVLPATLRQWVQFALTRRGVSEEWIAPVVAAVDEHLPKFEAALDDDAAWGPAKEIAAELEARGVDVTDKQAVDAVISQLNAARLARRLTE
jgi:hypothetical protein